MHAQGYCAIQETGVCTQKSISATIELNIISRCGSVKLSIKSKIVQSKFRPILALVTVIAFGLIGTLLLVLTHAATPITNTCSRSAIMVPSCGVLWGVYVPGEALSSLETQVGRQFDLFGSYQDFEATSNSGKIPNPTTQPLITAGQTQLADWQPRVYSTGAVVPWADIAAGNYDTSVIIPQAQRIKAIAPTKIFLTFGSESNDISTHPAATYGTAAQYVAAYQHIYNVFKAQGVTNVVWVWDTTGSTASTVSSYYPGDAYVDWLGYDPYNFYGCNNDNTWKSPLTTFGNYYNWVSNGGLGTGAETKPMILDEYGSHNDAEDPITGDSNWYSQIPAALAQLPRLKAVVEFSSVGICDTTLDNAADIAGFKSAGLSATVLGTSGSTSPPVSPTPTPPPADTTPPSVSITAPSNNATISGVTTVTGTASDNVGVSKVELYIDGTTVATDTSTPYTFSVDTTKYANTTHTLYLEAFDAAGNDADSSTVHVTVDNTVAPTVTSVSPSSGSMAGATQVIVTGTGFVAGDTVTFGGATATGVTVNSATQITATTPSGAIGAVVVTVTSPDEKAGFLDNAYTYADQTPPTQPVNTVSSSQPSNSIVLSWSPSTDNVGVAGYKILRNGVVVGTTASTTYTDSGLLANTNYSYTVIAYDAAGNDSQASAALVVATKPAPDTTPPSMPTGLTASAVSATQVNLSWSPSTDNVGVAGYIVERNGAVVAKVSAASYVDTALTASTNYSYVVEAYDAAGNVSNPSSTVTVKTPNPPDTTPPSMPTGLTASAVSATQVNLSWSPSTDNVGVAGYIVERNGVKISTSTATSFGDATVSPNTNYSYTVIAYDAAGNDSQASAPATVATGSVAAYSVPGLTATYFNNTTLTYNLNTITEVDPTLNYNWGSTAPASNMPATDWSARWTGRVIAPTTGTYTFYTNTDDGVYLWLNGKLVISDWHDHSATENSATVTLTAGQAYPIKMEYYQDQGVASAQLLWSGPGISQALIPYYLTLDK
jgi:chitodextrinase